MGGLAQYGCHADPFQWDIKVNDETCSQCCDSTTCSVNATVCEEIVQKTEGDDVAAESSGIQQLHAPFTFFALAMMAMGAMLW
jgi:hypothetical protein